MSLAAQACEPIFTGGLAVGVLSCLYRRHVSSDRFCFFLTPCGCPWPRTNFMPIFQLESSWTVQVLRIRNPKPHEDRFGECRCSVETLLFPRQASRPRHCPSVYLWECLAFFSNMNSFQESFFKTTSRICLHVRVSALVLHLIYPEVLGKWYNLSRAFRSKKIIIFQMMIIRLNSKCLRDVSALIGMLQDSSSRTDKRHFGEKKLKHSIIRFCFFF